MPSESSSSASEDAFFTDSDVVEDFSAARADAAPAKPAKAPQKASATSTAPLRRPEPHESTLILRNSPLFFELLDASESGYNNHAFIKKFRETSRNRGPPCLWDVLAIPKDLFSRNKNVSYSMSSIRNVFLDQPALSRTMEALESLRTRGEVICKLCIQKNARVGKGLCRTPFITAHNAKQHGKKEVDILSRADSAALMMRRDKVSLDVALALVEPIKRQSTLQDCGLQSPGEVLIRSQADTVWIGRAIAGGNGVAGVPPYNISKIFDKTFRVLFNFSKRGTPSATSIVKSHVPNAVEIVKMFLKKSVQKQPVSFGIDCGSSDLLHGVKILAVEISSPALPFTFLAHSEFFYEHERGTSQADILENVRMDYGIEKRNIHFISADNASVNQATLRILQNEHGWVAQYARCLPHCLNLVLQKFLDVFDGTFKFKSFLRTTRSFLKAGGAFSRKATVLEYGVSLSSLDFADTRWESACKAMTGLMTPQSDAEMRAAAYLLEKKAKKGDKDAAEALKGPPVKQLRFIALSEALEEIAQALPSARAERAIIDPCANFLLEGGDPALTPAEATCQNLQDYLSDVGNVAAMCLIHIILQDVPTVFKIIQKSCGQDDEDEDDDDGNTAAGEPERPSFPIASAAVMELTASLMVFKDAAAVKRLLREVETRCREIRKYVVDKEVRLDIISQDKADELRQAYEVNLSLALTNLFSTLRDASKAVEEAAALPKLKESVAALQVSESFLLSSKFPAFTSPEKLCDFLLIPEKERTHSIDVALLQEAATLARFERKPRSTLKTSMQFWMSPAAKKSLPLLSKYAVQYLARPSNNAGVERYFSILNHMAQPNRQRMQLETLEDLFFLRCNGHVMGHIAEQAADAAAETERSVATNILAGNKRKRENEERDLEELTRAVERAHEVGGGSSSAAAAIAVDDSGEEAVLSD